MRVLSLGFGLPHLQVDNFTWASAPSFFDYDAIAVQPAALSTLIETVCGEGEGVKTYNEEPLVNGVTTATETGLRDLLVRRREETETLLGRGGLVICFAYPDAPHSHVAGFTGCHRYYWLPAPAGFSYGAESLRPADGNEAVPTDYEHPFAELFERQRSTIRYRARFLEIGRSVAGQGKVIARSTAGAAIGLDLSVGGGRVIFLPAFPESLARSSREQVGEVLMTSIRNLLLTTAEGPAPTWIGKHTLPGGEVAERRLEKAEAALEKAESDLDEAQRELRGVDRFRRLLWQEGKYGLDLPVRDALTELGMKTYSKPDDAAVFSYGKDTILLETQGSSEAVGMDPHYRLRQRLEAQIAQAKRPRGLIVINGHRETDPDERPKQYEESLRIAAESMRYCVVDTLSLFAAVKAKLGGDKSTATAFLDQLLRTEGVFAPEGGLRPDEGSSDEQ